jgi:hypothetical protein
VLGKVWASSQHLRRGRPSWPHSFAANLCAAEPLESFLTDAYPVSQRGVVFESDIERVSLGVDDETSRRLLVYVFYQLPPIARLDLGQVGFAVREAVILGHAVVKALVRLG